jgi:sugar porter (SP) family MFS transporter
MAASCRAFLAAFVASIGAFLFGLDIGYIGPILECASFKRDVAHLPNWADPSSSIASGTVGLIVGTFSIGCIFAALPVVSSYFLDTWGRRNSIIIGTVVYIASCVIQARAMKISTMYVGRLVTGASIGLLSSVVPIYQSEMAHPSLRGCLTSLYQLMITAGILVAAFLDMLFVVHDNGWRTVIWLQILPALVILVWMPFLPRSPRWLVQQGRLAEAESVLKTLRDHEEAAEEFKSIVNDYQVSCETGEASWKEALSGRGGKLVAIGVSLQLLQQLVGMNAFMYFGPRIFKDLGLEQNKFQTINNAVNFLSTFPALYLADRAGRKSLLVIGAFGMLVACLVMGFVGTYGMKRQGENWHANAPSIGPIMAACVFSFVMSFACTWGPIVWVYCAEIFPLKYRCRAVGMTTAANWVGNYIIAQVSPMLLERLGFGMFFIFGAFCFMSLVLAAWLPETKGLLLENVQRIFDEKLGEEAAGENRAKISTKTKLYGAAEVSDLPAAKRV